MKRCYCFFCRAKHDERLFDMQQMLLDGEGVVLVAKTLCVTKSMVSRVKKDLGLKQQTVYPQKVRLLAEKLLDDGCAYAEVGRTLGVDPTTVAGWFPGRGFTRLQVFEYISLRRLEAKIRVY